MFRSSRGLLLVVAVMLIAVVAIACDSATEKPTAEPPTPTPIPTVASQSTSTNPALSIRDALADPEVIECLSEQLDIDPDQAASAIGPEILGRIGPAEFEMIAECGVELPQRIEDGGALFGAGLAGSRLADPEIRDCLTEELGEDYFDNLGRGSGIGLEPESLAAFETCGLNFGDTAGSGGFRFGGRGDLGGDEGIFGGRIPGGGGFAGADSFRECLTEALGDDALLQLRNPEGPPSPELQDALSECGGSIGIQVPTGPDDSAGNGGDQLFVEPEIEPTATAIPISELTIEQLTCLSGELDPAALASAVVATSAGDLSDIPDEVLAALQTCGVGS